jgi:hypothetical protein
MGGQASESLYMKSDIFGITGRGINVLKSGGFPDENIGLLSKSSKVGSSSLLMNGFGSSGTKASSFSLSGMIMPSVVTKSEFDKKANPFAIDKSIPKSNTNKISSSGFNSNYNFNSGQSTNQGFSYAQDYKQDSGLQYKQQNFNPPKGLDINFSGIGGSGFGGGFVMPELGGFALPTRRKRGRVSGFDIAPSFTGIVENIKMTSPIKVSRSFGVTPFQTRGLYQTKSGKPGKGSYFKLTDI